MGVVKVRGHGDDGLGDGRSEITLGVALELAQDECGKFWWRVALVAELDAQHFACGEVVGEAEREELELVLHIFDAPAHKALDAVDGALGRFDEIFTGGVAHDDLVALVEGDDRRHKVQSVFAGDDDRTVVLHVGDQRVGGAEIDSDDAVSSHRLAFEDLVDFTKEVADISAAINDGQH